MVVCDTPTTNDALHQRFGAAAQSNVMGSHDVNDDALTSGKMPINIKLMVSKTFVKPAINPREYQVELYNEAMKQNVIIYLGTGRGKTFIIVMFLNSAKIDAAIQSGRKVVFLAPTQDLVQQQAEYIYTKTPYKIRVYCGRTCQTGKHVDKWKDEEWQRQLIEIDVLFMTPMIFTNAIVSGFIKWSDFSAVIFDEVHHAHTMKRGASGHPYSKAFEHFNYSIGTLDTPPRIIGLTASLLNNMPKDLSRISEGIAQLEHKARGRCITSTAGVDVEPRMVLHIHSLSGVNKHNDIICDMFSEYGEKMMEALDLKNKRNSHIVKFGLSATNDQERDFLAFLERLNLASTGISLKPGSFHKVMRQLVAIRQSSGLWTMSNICLLLADSLKKHASNRCISDQIKPLYLAFSAILLETVRCISNFLGSDWRSVLLEYSQPKTMAMLQVLSDEHARIMDKTSYKQTFSCIIFVQSRVEVLALYNWLKQVSENSEKHKFIRVGYAIGMSATAASKWACITRRRTIDQSSMLDKFRRNELNVVVTTSVLEEGIDLPICSTVIRYDPAKNFRVYIQSRGRSRQIESSYVSLVDDENAAKVATDLQGFNLFNEHIKKVLQKQDIGLNLPALVRTSGGDGNLSEKELYEDEVFETPNFRIDACTAAVLLNIYCSRVTRSYPFSNGLVYRRFQPTEDTFQTGLLLPYGSPIKHEILGKVKAKLKLANSAAIIEALRQLNQVGELNERGVPFKCCEERTDKVLAKYQLRPDTQPIDDPDERSETKDDKLAFYNYPWRAFQVNQSERLKASTNRRHKLYRIEFEPDKHGARAETEQFFTSSKLGIIVDASRDCQLWPTTIHSHYGVFKVRYHLLQDNLLLDEHAMHDRLLNYTYRMIQIWSIDFIKKFDFSTRCLFYFAPLDPRAIGGIDIKQADESFRLRVNSRLRPNDVVKLARIYQRCRDDSTRLFLVKNVRLDMNATSPVPGLRGMNFCELALERNNIQVRDLEQPVIEVVPISRQVAKYSHGKKSRSGHSTTSVFYLAQFLDLLDDNASVVYQSFNLPPIIYRLYLSYLCADLDGRFKKETAKQREHEHRASTPAVAMDDQNEEEPISDGQQSPELHEREVTPEQAEDQITNDVDNDGDHPYSEYEEDSYDSDSSFIDSSDYEESDQGEDGEDDVNNNDEKIAHDSAEIAKAEELWKEYEQNMIQQGQQPIMRERSYAAQKYVNTSPNFYQTFGQLRSDTSSHLNVIVDGLQQLRRGIITDARYVGEENVLVREGAQVDVSIKPPFRLENLVSPVRDDKSREFGILEALTQRRATEGFNLEALENVGDAYLKYCISVALFKSLKGSDEGALTDARSRLVGNKHFTHLARRNKLGSFAVANKFQESSVASMLGAKEPFRNRLKPKDLADTIESLVGAYLVFCGEFEAILAIDWLGLKLISEDMFTEFHRCGVAFSRAPSALPLTGDESADAKLMHLYKMNQKRSSRFQQILGYEFSDPSYLIQALTHASAPAAVTNSYERLEFLGDAILDFLVTITLYQSGGRLREDPGQITSSRSAIVNNCTLAKLAVKYRYDIFLQHANQELLDLLNTITERMCEDPELEFLKEPQYDRITKLLGDIYESVAGAIYLDSGNSLDAVWGTYYPMMKSIIDQEIDNPSKNPITQVYEKYTGRVTYEYTKVNTEGSYEINSGAYCIIEGAGKYFGIGMNRAAAKKRAAEKALREAPDLPPLERPSGSSRGGRQHSRGGRGRGGRGGGGHNPRQFRRDSGHPQPGSSMHQRYDSRNRTYRR